MINARQDQIGRLLKEKMAYAHDDAVGRRAADDERAIVHLPETQRLVQRE